MSFSKLLTTALRDAFAPVAALDIAFESLERLGEPNILGEVAHPLPPVVTLYQPGIMISQPRRYRLQIAESLGGESPGFVG